MIAAVIFLAGSFLAGLGLFPKEKNNAVWGVLAGSALGVAALFLLSLGVGLTAWTVALSGLLGAAFFVWVYVKKGIHSSLEKPIAAVLFVSLVFFFLAAVALFRIEDVPRGVRIDFGFHQSIVTSMAQGNFPPENPLLAGEPLRYYFLPHLFSAALMVGGLDVQWATWIPFVLWNAALTAGIFLLARRLAGSGKVAALAVLLFLFNGTFAFIPYLQAHDVLGHFDAFLNDPGFLSDYRDSGFPFENNLVAQNFFTRSFPPGFGILVLLVFGMLERWDLRKLGLLVGLLPMIHLPSFGLWVLFAIAYATMFDRRKAWLEHGAIAAVLAAPALAFLLGSNAATAIRPHVGWLAPDASALGFLVFWMGNIGLYAVLAGWAVLKKPQSPLAKLTLAAFPAVVMGNLFLVAPYAWDNIKLFLLFFLFLAIGAAAALAEIWKKGAVFKTAALVLVSVMTLTGFLHLASVMAHRSDAMYPANDWQACQWLDQNARPDALLLTDGTHTCASALAGRNGVAGPLEWLQHHGLDYGNRLKDNDAMLQGDCRLLGQYNVSYFYDGGYLGRGASVNRGFWQRQPSVYEKQGVTIYRATCEPD